MSEGISTEIHVGTQTKESARATIEKRVQQVVNDVRKNPATKKVALAATTGLIFFSTACGIGRPPEVSAVPFVPSTPTEESFSGLQGNADVAPSAISQKQQTQEEDKDMQTRFMEAAEKERKQQLEALKINKEAFKQLPSHTLIIDNEFREGLPGINYVRKPIDEETILKHLLMDEYISPEQLEKEFGKDFRERPVLIDIVSKKYPKVALAYGMLERNRFHGEKVTAATRKVLETFGFKNEEAIFFPSENFYMSDSKPIEIKFDDLGNMGFFQKYAGSESLIELINEVKKSYPQITRFNMSFEVGEGSIFLINKKLVTDENINVSNIFDNGKDEWVYAPDGTELIVTDKGIKARTKEGDFVEPLTESQFRDQQKRNSRIETLDSPELKVNECYTKEDAPKNLPYLFQVARTFPDSVFFAAAGNTVDDLREMKGQQPENLVFAAQWNSSIDAPDGNVNGADIYVDNHFFGLGDGSSFSTPTMSALADILESYGLNNSQIVETLKSSTDPVTYNKEDEIISASLFNPQKFKAAVEALKANQEANTIPRN